MNFSPLMLGTVQFGLNYGVANTHGKPSFDTVKTILKTAANSNITALDTAASYGESEEVLGKALTELGLKDKMSVVSKVPPVPEGCDPAEFIENSVRNSLRRLQIPVIPVVLFHRESDYRYLPEMRSLIGKGLILEAGVSLDSQPYSHVAGLAEYIQLPCNVMDHRFDDAIRNCRGHIFIRSVYLQGMLLMPEEKILPGLVPHRRKLESFGIPLNELCMRYLLSLPGNKSILTGVDTPEQLQENVRLAALGPLPDDLMKAVFGSVPLLEESLIRPGLWKKK